MEIEESTKLLQKHR